MQKFFQKKCLYSSINYGDGAANRGIQTARHVPFKPAPAPAYAAARTGAAPPPVAPTRGMLKNQATPIQVPMHVPYVTGPALTLTQQFITRIAKTILDKIDLIFFFKG